MVRNCSFFIVCLTSFLLLTLQGCKGPENPKGADSVKTGKEGDSKFEDHVRTTEFQTAEQERAGFKLTPGFEITLFAS